MKALIAVLVTAALAAAFFVVGHVATAQPEVCPPECGTGYPGGGYPPVFYYTCDIVTDAQRDAAEGVTCLFFPIIDKGYPEPQETVIYDPVLVPTPVTPVLAVTPTPGEG